MNLPAFATQANSLASVWKCSILLAINCPEVPPRQIHSPVLENYLPSICQHLPPRHIHLPVVGNVEYYLPSIALRCHPIKFTPQCLEMFHITCHQLPRGATTSNSLASVWKCSILLAINCPEVPPHQIHLPVFGNVPYYLPSIAQRCHPGKFTRQCLKITCHQFASICHPGTFTCQCLQMFHITCHLLPRGATPSNSLASVWKCSILLAINCPEVPPHQIHLPVVGNVPYYLPSIAQRCHPIKFTGQCLEMFHITCHQLPRRATQANSLASV
jgi:hypothetical protein